MKIFKRLAFRLLGILGISVLCYLLGILLGALIPQNSHFQQDPTSFSIPIYVRSNGFHSFLILPVEAPNRNWARIFKKENFEGLDSSYTHISLGWGDKAFFMDTPTWEDFTLRHALNALFLPSPSVVQVSFLAQRPNLNKNCVELFLKQSSYEDLCVYLDSTLLIPPRGPTLIPGKSWTGRDNFYIASGKYSLFYTCNNWVNQGLAKAGVRTGLWTPLDQGLFYQLNKISYHESFQ